jgi:hypothetical protein
MSSEVNLELVECLELIETIHNHFVKLYQFVPIDDMYRVIHKTEDLREAKKLISESIKIISELTGTHNPVQLRYAFLGAFIDTIREGLEQIPYYKKKKFLKILKNDLVVISLLEKKLSAVIKVLSPSEKADISSSLPFSGSGKSSPLPRKSKLASSRPLRRLYASSYVKVVELLREAIIRIKNFKTAINTIIDIVEEN